MPARTAMYFLPRSRGAAGDVILDSSSPEFIEMLDKLKKGAVVSLDALNIKEGETSPPKRYTWFHDSGDGECRTAD